VASIDRQATNLENLEYSGNSLNLENSGILRVLCNLKNFNIQITVTRCSFLVKNALEYVCSWGFNLNPARGACRAFPNYHYCNYGTFCGKVSFVMNLKRLSKLGKFLHAKAATAFSAS